MESTDLIEQITALVDNEIQDQDKISKLKDTIQKEPSLKFEFQVQSIIKNEIHSRLGNNQAPASLKNKIINQIIFENTRRFNVEIPKPAWWQFLLKPQYAIIVLAIFGVGLIYLLFLTDNNFEKLAQQQNGRNNMFVQARSNFNKIIRGQLPVQIFSSDPYTIKDFFREKGVQYETSVPKFKDLEIIGATVSETKGEKFAHHIYKDKEGKLFYFYQVDEKCIKRDKCLNLSSDLLSMIDEGKYYTYKKNDQSVLVWKHNSNVCIIVSNDGDMDKLESRFVSHKW